MSQTENKTTESVATQTERLPTTIYSPRTDAVEFDDRLELRLDIPGVAAEAIDVRFEDNTLSIRATREHQETAGFLHNEFGAAQFRRAFTLPKGFDATRIEANLDHGVLTLSLPKAEEVKARKIRIGSA